MPSVLRPPAEVRYRDELTALASSDTHARPPGWRLSPRAVRDFICGTDTVERKFFGDDALVERAIIGLAGSRGLMLVGEPGTAKTMLGELLACAVSGVSTHVLQGTAGLTDDQLKYSWNYALLLAEGPSLRALVASPLYLAMRDGQVLRFDEITRCAPEIQDGLIGVLSEKALVVPELEGEDRLLLARPGFNVIATANVRDRGVNEMSSALKRRFNFETVTPLASRSDEIDLVMRESARLLAAAQAPVEMARDVVALLVAAFHDLRSGVTEEGIQVERPAAVLSTAEAVSVAFQAGLDAFYYGARRLQPEHVGRHLAGGVLKDEADDAKRLRQYLDVVVRRRAQQDAAWRGFLEAARWISGR